MEKINEEAEEGRSKKKKKVISLYSKNFTHYFSKEIIRYNYIYIIIFIIVGV